MTMDPLTVYDKKTCGTCKKAKAFLDGQGVPYTLKNIETDPPPQQLLEQLIDPARVKASLNSRCTLYREKQLGKNLPTKADALKLMAEDPNLIKRPVIVNGSGQAIQGFDETSLRQFLAL